MNFDYLSSLSGFEFLEQNCIKAEQFVRVQPDYCALSARKAMEFVVRFLYEAEVCRQDVGFTVFEMMTDARFIRQFNDPVYLNALHYVRKMGNVAAHDGRLQVSESLKVLEELHFIVGEFFVHLGLIQDYLAYQQPGGQRTPAAAAPVPAPSPPPAVAVPAVPESSSTAEPAPLVSEIIEEELVARFAQRLRTTRFSVAHQRDEEENKQLFLYASLREAGWPMLQRHNTALPGAAGIQCMLEDGDTVDYILYGRDNRPLAIIEHTKTRENLVAGRQRGIAVAAKLGVKLGYLPIVYYTNGYHIFCIDQLGYPPRRVFNFHSIEELELLKLRATMRRDLSNIVIDDNITNRDYQKEAISSTCQAFSSMRRRSLLVMATGTGKTRVSIALTDVLLKHNWVKNVLFLADRNSLVRQAHKNYTKLLPSVTTTVYAGGSMNQDPNARIMFSTYQTMINLVNEDTRAFGISRFDLIIIDEAHRSIFRKYGALFRYFDALMLGLTATPRSEENKNTYSVFRLPNGKPDYAYELEQAIAEKYLVGFSVQDKTTKLMRRGVVYAELSDEERQRLEDALLDDSESPGLVGTEIKGHLLNTKFINLGTIDAMLGELMKNGLKVEGGDKLGKTIIFAKRHQEAEKIVERFQQLYSHLGMDFCKLIDSKVEDSLTLIDQFGVRNTPPQLVVSVDMLDTGIDVPDILNLVFFKPVRSKIKFLQMIGRGTRLSENLFGPGLHKKGFLVMDYYDNFNYFSTRGTWSSTMDSNAQGMDFGSQTYNINATKLSILMNLQQSAGLNAFDLSYMHQLKAYFVSEVRGLNNDEIEVQQNMAFVSKYRTAENWDHISDATKDEIGEHILPLLHAQKDHTKIKSFDLLILTIQDQYPKREAEGKDPAKIRYGFMNATKAINDRMQALLKLATIPEVTSKRGLIQSMMDGDALFGQFSLEQAEKIRLALRDLMVYLPDEETLHIINVPDWIETDVPAGGILEKPYAEKAMDYLQTSKHTALAKLRNLDDLTSVEKQELEAVFQQRLGTLADYHAWSNQMPLLPFLRKIIGISEQAIKTKFGSFLNPETLNEQQLSLCQQIVSYARRNGDITATVLLHEAPFSDVDLVQVFGQKFSLVKQLVNGLHGPVA